MKRNTAVNVHVSEEGVSVLEVSAELRSLDVRFNGQRIWSFPVHPRGDSFHPWPEALAERLRGKAVVEVAESGVAEPLATAELQFGANTETFRFVDDLGRPLMINKWQRAAPMLADGDGYDRRDDLVAALAATRNLLEALGHQVFVVGGTALGPYRDGDLLPHDDDGDLAVFLGECEPADVALQMMRLSRQLSTRGYVVRVHSRAHLQVYSSLESEHPEDDLYIDVFAAYFSEGRICQPFHVRGPFRWDQLLPFQQLTIRGEQFNAPADLDAWLTLNYDADWATPQPGFEIRTPEDTARHFNGVYGAFNFHRHFWEGEAAEPAGDTEYVRGDPQIPQHVFRSAHVLNLGSGPNPALPKTITTQRTDATVVALDYADSVRRAASHSTNSAENIRVANLNFADYHAVLEFVATLPREPFDLYAGFVVETQDPERRQPGFWRLARMALMSGGDVVIDHLDQLATGYRFDDPRTWHLERSELSAEARPHGMRVRAAGTGTVRVAGEVRRYQRSNLELNLRQDRERTAPAMVRAPDSESVGHTPETDGGARGNTVRRRLRELRDRVLGTSAQNRQIQELRAEIAELRSNQRRVAEMMDVVEELTLESRGSDGADSSISSAVRETPERPTT